MITGMTIKADEKVLRRIREIIEDDAVFEMESIIISFVRDGDAK